MIAIIDYQMGNLRSVQKGFEKVGHAATISSDPAELAKAEKIVLPGEVVRFDVPREYKVPHMGWNQVRIRRPAPLLNGIADGTHEGLGILRGEVRRFEVPPEFKVPHMGWNQGRILRRAPVLEGIADGAHFYFVHSYYAVPQDAGVVAIET